MQSRRTYEKIMQISAFVSRSFSFFFPDASFGGGIRRGLSSSGN
jgi:hypothetical protein